MFVVVVGGFQAMRTLFERYFSTRSCVGGGTKTKKKLICFFHNANLCLLCFPNDGPLAGVRLDVSDELPFWMIMVVLFTSNGIILKNFEHSKQTSYLIFGVSEE